MRAGASCCSFSRPCVKSQLLDGDMGVVHLFPACMQACLGCTCKLSHLGEGALDVETEGSNTRVRTPLLHRQAHTITTCRAVTRAQAHTHRYGQRWREGGRRRGEAAVGRGRRRLQI